jgi:hypothetical protein
MPMEETGNMLILLAAIAKRQNQQIDYLKPYAQLLQNWAQYLHDSLPDPPNQICTDVFVCILLSLSHEQMILCKLKKKRFDF